ncbi:Peptidase C48, SUMO/Sentrin/Ubl1 [Kalmanozyma brasiliensis GHG001]|uniref:Peptidase C48, SUMO/Sentrin/Ubl1 n=1 Tax=Kalmanozyma brasiliensis (strain GHG001) TaxID=1365824 RepID=UPI002867C656|nr:Peptidase C48, SUMO/Sentrin/Ubl1 [Kalmanozyma brasiliensis GHG001]KAF6767342.1 Peptidase C48, SUMO/Sentrin/Ubl1 [Kalmanozyma brasiliensis GHG001]
MPKKDLTERIAALSEKLQTKHGAIGQVFHPASSLDVNFIADTWPYHSDDADISKIFAKALTRTTAGATNETIKSPTHVIPTVISRLGFYQCQYQQVDEAFSTAFIATMALELAASGGRTIKASFNDIRPQHLVLSYNILKSHRLLKTWMDFTPQLGISCHLRDSPKDDRDAQEQERRHDELIHTAINVMLRWHFRRARESWLKPKRHRDEDPKFQWELLRGLTEGPTWLEAGPSGPVPWLPSYGEISRRDINKHEQKQLIVKAASKHQERLTAHAKTQGQKPFVLSSFHKSVIDSVAYLNEPQKVCGQDLYGRDISTLGPGRIVSYAVMDAYFGLVSRTHTSDRYKILDTALVDALTMLDYDEVAPKMGLPQESSMISSGQTAPELLLLPMQLFKKHWSILAIDTKHSRMDYFDSRRTPEASKKAFSVGRKLLEGELKHFSTWQGQLQSPSQDLAGSQSWVEHVDDRFPQQTNAYDGGVFAAQAVRQLCTAYLSSADFSQQEWLVDQDAADALRFKMFFEITARQLDAN